MMFVRPHLDDETQALRKASEKPDCPGELLARLAEASSDGELRAAMHPNTPFETLLMLAPHRPALVLKNPSFRLGLIACREALRSDSRTDLPAYGLRSLVRDPDLPEDIMQVFAMFPDPHLLVGLSKRENLSPAVKSILQTSIDRELKSQEASAYTSTITVQQLQQARRRLDPTP